MKNIFAYDDYKDFLREHLHSKDQPRGLQTQMAKHLSCQSAYIYQVLKGKGQLTEDQAYKTTTFFKFTKAEKEYFLLLVRLQKAVSSELVEFLKKEIRMKVQEELNLKKRSDADEAEDNRDAWDFYFSDSNISMIHLLTDSEKYQTADAISKKLKISIQKTQKLLEQLARFGFVTFKDRKWEYSGQSMHLPKDSHYNTLHQVVRRNQALTSITAASQKDDIHFTSLFTLDEKSYKNLQKQVADFIEDAQKTIHKGGTTEVYAFCLDLFSPV